MHTTPQGLERLRGYTLQHYLPALLSPPLDGVPCRGPGACHRLDYRVSGPVVAATSEEAMREIKDAFAQRKVQKTYRALVCGRVGDEGQKLHIDSPIDGKEATTEAEVLRVVRCPHYGHLSELRLQPKHGRYHQLRIHCAEVLGAPIVNEDVPMHATAAAAWPAKNGGAPLPPFVERGAGSLMLQAEAIALPPPGSDGQEQERVVRVDVSEKFQQIADCADRAWQRGWRTDETGRSYRV
eukprot:TRINITY_DN18875_c0_g1_i2.p1 TRINITY_DN18875_c0_g1~~TRINITY_DN18875_c0_g1_i2.p1  ORF type:complete len:239 (-),score=29.42 TRINITY_DN18875_c0_g1_i2:670-1386(-)